MATPKEKEILDAEESLRKAMLESDVATLDHLLSSKLVFTNHLGQILGKQDDLNAHKSGLLHISNISVDEQQISIQQDTAIVFAKVTIEGSYNGTPANGAFRFTRVWQSAEGNHWEVIAAHSSATSDAY